MKTECVGKKWRYTAQICRDALCACAHECVCVCAYKYGSRDNRKRLIMADVFQRAQLSCLMWKTFTRSFVLHLKTWPRLGPLRCAAVRPKPEENLFSLLILLSCGNSKGCKHYFLSRYKTLCFFPLILANALTNTDVYFCKKEVSLNSAGFRKIPKKRSYTSVIALPLISLDVSGHGGFWH